MSYTCLACGKSVTAGSSKCSVCGFPVIGVAQSSPEILAQMKEMAKEYMDSKMGEYSIGIQSHKYVYKDGKIQLEQTTEAEIVGYDKLGTNEILWSDKVYKGVDSKKPVSLEVYVQKKGGSKQTHTVEITPPNMDITYIGVKRDGVSAQIVWGNKENFSTSKTFALIV